MSYETRSYSSDVQANTPSYRSYQFKHCMTLIYFFLLFQHLTLIKSKKKCIHILSSSQIFHYENKQKARKKMKNFIYFFYQLSMNKYKPSTKVKQYLTFTCKDDESIRWSGISATAILYGAKLLFGFRVF